ncbi:olfactory receptor 13C2-like [Siphateles boraxobius]|uniref:olfactory receptor 13C2-like n=1 Tax=Siphateles boraxobius TaxID=180520 RepID=UPI004062887F
MRYYYIFLFIAYIISFLGNSCLMFVIIMDRNLHTSKYIAVFNLSLTNICENTAVIPQLLNAVLFGNQLISYGLCMSNMLFVSLQSLTLTLLSFDRLAICLPLRYHLIVSHRSMLVMIGALWTLALMQTITAAVFMTRLSFCRTSVIILRFCDHGSVFPCCVIMSVLFQVIIMFPVFCIIFSYRCIAVTLFRITTPQRATKTCTAHLILVAVFYVPICLKYVFQVLVSINTAIIILSLTSTLPTHL